MSKYQDPFSTDKRNTVFIDVNDPRAQGWKLGQTESRMGREIEVVEQNSKPLTLSKYVAPIPTYYWISIYNKASSGRSIVTDSEKNIYVYGYTADSIKYPTLLKYQQDGTLLWQKKIDVSYDSYGQEIKINNNGDILLGGIFGNGSTQDTVLICVSSSGSILWQRKINTTIDIPGNYYIAAYPNISVDSNSNIYLSITKDSSPDYTELIKYNSSGVLQWQKKYSSTSFVMSGRVAIDSNNNKYFASTAYDDPSYTSQMHIVKYDSSDTLVWQKKLQYLGFYSGTVNPSYVNTDSNGNIYIDGYTSATGTDATTLFKYNSSGVLQWNKTINNQSAITYGTQIDSSGNIYWLLHSGLITPVILKLDNSGNIIYKKQITCVWNGPAGSAVAVGYDITLDASGDMVLAGRLDPSDGVYSDKEFIIKLPADGSLTGTYIVPLGHPAEPTVSVTYSDSSLITITSLSYTQGDGFLTISNGDLTDSAGSFTSSSTNEVITKKDIP